MMLYSNGLLLVNLKKVIYCVHKMMQNVKEKAYH